MDRSTPSCASIPTASGRSNWPRDRSEDSAREPCASGRAFRSKIRSSARHTPDCASSSMTDPSRRPRVVIVGAGFGGLACARKLDGAPVDVLLLDRHNYHLFTPLLYQVATGLLNPSDIAYPLRAVFRRSRNVRFRQATVDGVDVGRRIVRLDDGAELPFDYLVLAAGSVDNYFGNQAVARVSIGLKALEDATRMRNHVLTCLERADAETDRQARRALLTFVVVGGGPTGVECSGALTELMDIVAGKDYHDVTRDEIRIMLVEG